MSTILACKSKLPLPDLWRVLWPGSEGPAVGRRQQMVRAAWREERSGSVNVSDSNGVWRWYDHGEKHGGDEIHLIMQARACTVPEAIRLYHELAGIAPEVRERKAGAGGWLKDAKLVATYDYRTADGALVFEKLRYEPGPDGAKKTFLIRRPAKEGMSQGSKVAKRDHKTGRWWLWSRHGLPPLLYRMEEWSSRPERLLWLVEGEKDADALRARGELATTAPDGAGKWNPEFTRALAGRKVVLCGDNDRPGVEHVAMVGRELAPVAAELRVVDWPALGVGDGKCDAAGWLGAASDSEISVRIK